MTLILRTDPAYPMLWRDVDVVQFGWPAAASIRVDAPWKLRLLDEFRRGISESGAALLAELGGAHPREAERLAQELGTVLHRDLAESVPPSMTVTLESLLAADTLASAAAQALRTAHYEAPTDDDPPHLAILVAQHALDPRRCAPHMRVDRPHLPVVARGGRVEIGPLIVPGRSACASCLDLHRRDQDPRWGAVLTQLVRAPAWQPPVSLVQHAVGTLLDVLDEVRRGDPAPTGAVRVVGHDHRSTLEVEPHPDCACGASTAHRTTEPMTAADTARPRPLTTRSA